MKFAQIFRVMYSQAIPTCIYLTLISLLAWRCKAHLSANQWTSLHTLVLTFLTETELKRLDVCSSAVFWNRILAGHPIEHLSGPELPSSNQQSNTSLGSRDPGGVSFANQLRGKTVVRRVPTLEAGWIPPDNLAIALKPLQCLGPNMIINSIPHHFRVIMYWRRLVGHVESGQWQPVPCLGWRRARQDIIRIAISNGRSVYYAHCTCDEESKWIRMRSEWVR